jgi:GTP cyclohydrolase I
MYEEIFSGVKQNPEKELEVMLDQKHHEIILLKDIPLYSICEHHFLPFVGRAHIAYIPSEGRVTGLSKLARVVDILSKRLQVQERLTTQIADIIMKKLKPLGCMVVIEAEHLCLSMRGVKKPGTLTVTSAVRGIFKENEKTRSETLSLIKS